ncbi:MAG: DNA gyrase C-terminal beta-propeller domain-containing protein [Armatimonadota bacterium]
MADAGLIILADGRGKLVSPDEYPVRKRGGKGVKTWGKLDGASIAAVAHVQTGVDQKALIVTARGMAIMIRVDDVAKRSRTGGGVRLINVAPGDRVVSVTV